jgi:hypothetical protein
MEADSFVEVKEKGKKVNECGMEDGAKQSKENNIYGFSRRHINTTAVVYIIYCPVNFKTRRFGDGIPSPLTGSTYWRTIHSPEIWVKKTRLLIIPKTKQVYIEEYLCR